MKVYHAHGFVVRNNWGIPGEEKWENSSVFGEIFNDFERAKAYLLECFEDRLHRIYAKDDLSRCDEPDKTPLIDFSKSWRMEYIDEYIFYDLVISEIDTEQRWSDAALVSEIPSKLEWHLSDNGEIQTRYLKFEDGTEREFRPTDELPEAGTKFKKGDLVQYTEWKCMGDCPYVYIVAETPKSEKVHTMSGENHYKLLYLDDKYFGRGAAKVCREEFHEADLELCGESGLELDRLKEPILTLQQIVKGERQISPELWGEIMSGHVVFNMEKSWREIPELYGKKKNTEE